MTKISDILNKQSVVVRERVLQNHCDKCRDRLNESELVFLKIPEMIYLCKECAKDLDAKWSIVGERTCWVYREWARVVVTKKADWSLFTTLKI